MGTFVTQDTTPTIFPDGDKSAAPGVSMRPGWTSDNVLTASEMNTIKDALLDCRTAIRALGGAAAYSGTVSTRDENLTTVLTLTPDDNYVTTYEVTVTGRSDAGDLGFASRFGITVRRSGTSVNAVGSLTSIWSHKDDPGLDAEANFSGTNVVIQVTGLAATDFDWACTAIAFKVT